MLMEMSILKPQVLMVKPPLLALPLISKDIYGVLLHTRTEMLMPQPSLQSGIGGWKNYDKHHQLSKYLLCYVAML